MTARSEWRGGWAAGILACVLLASAAGSPRAAKTTLDKQWGTPKPDKALVYLIRERQIEGAARTAFAYADDAFLATIDYNGYAFAYVEPGEYLFWLNWARINRRMAVEAGQTYYLLVFENFLDLPEAEGKARLDEVRFYCTPLPKEMETARQHVRERQARAGEFSQRDTGERAGPKSRREAHVAKWPRVALASHGTLVVEDFAITDPEASQRKPQDLLAAAPARMADRLRADIDPGTFDEVRRGRLDGTLPGSAVLRVTVTRYAPGGLWAMAAGLAFEVTLIDGATGAELARFRDERTALKGNLESPGDTMKRIEINVAGELAAWLEQSRGRGTSTSGASAQAPTLPAAPGSPADP